MANYMGHLKKISEVSKILEKQDLDWQKEAISEILEIVKSTQTKLDEQSKLLTKIAMFVSKLYHDGKLNQETFDKLDEFLKEYYDDSNLTQNY
ncbi:hypothetical protein [Nitrosopumilus sp.]|uniref:hypothetical protein n=1 Tax=Nitrosopumilus sp. TaxID=2024843 RepID=UPI003D133606